MVLLSRCGFIIQCRVGCKWRLLRCVGVAGNILSNEVQQYLASYGALPFGAVYRSGGQINSRALATILPAILVGFLHSLEMTELFKNGCFYKSFIKQLTCSVAGRISRDRCVDKVCRRGSGELREITQSPMFFDIVDT